MCSNLSENTVIEIDKRMKILYPMVDEEEIPLPRNWSAMDKSTHIGLSHNNFQVHYKSHGSKVNTSTPSDGSVRTTHAIPPSCGLYYFEIKVVSKGSNDTVVIGLSSKSTNLNILPGLSRNSYGYRGNDGQCFSGSPSGQGYGPTFTCGDVVGCGLNLVDGSCFYTKNGHHLGVVFRNLSGELYPTVGLRVPGQVVEGNFGQEPFLFDIEGEMKELKRKTKEVIENLSWPEEVGSSQGLLRNMVSNYLVHQGYSKTAEAFASKMGQEIPEEELTSMKNRQRVQKLVMAGRIGEAISTTEELYPGLLQLNQDLHLRLKVRQFIEMVSGRDSQDTLPENWMDTNQHNSYFGHRSSIANRGSNSEGSNGNVYNNAFTPMTDSTDTNKPLTTSDRSNENNHNNAPGNTNSSKVFTSFVSNSGRFAALVEFGRSVQLMATVLEQTRGKSEANSRMLLDAFSLLAYEDPWNSPVGWQLRPEGRESVCAALNSAILESKSIGRRSSLEISMAHSKLLQKLMFTSGVAVCAFTDIDAWIN